MNDELDITAQVPHYMTEARAKRLPPAVAREAKHRLLDTLAAMVSAS